MNYKANDSQFIDFLRPSLKGRKILIGVTGSIAAFKVHDLVRDLKKAGAEVRIILTASAKNFVTPLTLETLSGTKIQDDLWSSSELGTHHIEASRWADLFIVAPASANILSKMVTGLCDDLLSTELLAYQGNILVAPAMNPAMYQHAATQANLSTLRSRGIVVVGPVSGSTACGEHGLGRMVEPSDLLFEIARHFFEDRKEKRILISMGPTRSQLDPVRYLSNHSSGKMGAALAWAAVRKGYDVSIVTGPTQVALPRSSRIFPVATSQEMYDRVLELWPTAQIYIGTAAVLDWQFAQNTSQKLKKENGIPDLKLLPSPDILAEVGKSKTSNQFVLGFAAETDSLIEHAQRKLENKNCDAVFVNDVSQSDFGFGSDKNAGAWVSDQVVEFQPMEKTVLADKLLKLVESMTETQTLPHSHGLTTSQQTNYDSSQKLS